MQRFVHVAFRIFPFRGDWFGSVKPIVPWGDLSSFPTDLPSLERVPQTLNGLFSSTRHSPFLSTQHVTIYPSSFSFFPFAWIPSIKTSKTNSPIVRFSSNPIQSKSINTLFLPRSYVTCTTFLFFSDDVLPFLLLLQKKQLEKKPRNPRFPFPCCQQSTPSTLFHHLKLAQKNVLFTE